MTDITHVLRSAADIVGAVRSGRERAVDVARHHLELIQGADRLNAVVWRDDSAMFEQARHIDQLNRGGGVLPPLAGLPIVVKDLFAVKGQPDTSASLATEGRLARDTDPFVAQALGQGAVQLGRSASPEFGMTTSCESDRWGITRNPWALGRTPGGSSGGSAAAVSAGLVPVALGSDGGGSIRVPAAFCGVVGLKPTPGYFEGQPHSWAGRAVDGIITRSVDDMMLVVEAMKSSHVGGPRTNVCGGRTHPAPTDVGPVTVGLVLEALDPRIRVDPACVAAAVDVARSLAEQGHRIVRKTPTPDMALLMDIYPRTIIPAWFSRMRIDHPDRLPAHVRRHFDKGLRMGVKEYLDDLVLFDSAAQASADHLFNDCDIVLTPTTATRVPAVGEIRKELLAKGGPDSRECERYEQTLAFTTVPSAMGAPAISLPTHWDDDGLPVGVQLIAPPWHEDLLLRLGRTAEDHYQWIDRVPPNA